jgi:hypothetical protein
VAGNPLGNAGHPIIGQDGGPATPKKPKNKKNKKKG